MAHWLPLLLLPGAHGLAVTGDLAVFDGIFASRTPRVLVHGASQNLTWTEGPTLLGGELLFSDTVKAKLLAVDVATGQLRLVRDRSGDCPLPEESWRAEPGSNGMALLASGKAVLLCQHGARRLAALDLATGELLPVAAEFDQRRLNGPNDVVLREEEAEGASFAYFTDPVYAWLEKERFEDLPYLDERVATEGPGHSGVYRVAVDGSGGGALGPPELVSKAMSRPNGLGFWGETLVVADCCQGAHNAACASGTSRWRLLRRAAGGEAWQDEGSIEDRADPERAVGGCADGFAVHRWKGRDLLLSSCFGGLCVVDLERREVLARLWTASEEAGGCKVSNVAVGDREIYLTGNCGVRALPLRRENEEL